MLTYLLQTFSLGSILKLVKINRDEALRGACLKSTLLHYLKPFTYKEPDRERESKRERKMQFYRKLWSMSCVSALLLQFNILISQFQLCSRCELNRVPNGALLRFNAAHWHSWSVMVCTENPGANIWIWRMNSDISFDSSSLLTCSLIHSCACLFANC